jgi:tetratricopeptide (TPR) repeat protein
MSDIHDIRGAYGLEIHDTAMSAKNTELYLKARIRLASDPQGQQKLAHAYCQAANAFLATGKVEQAIERYRTSIETHRNIPGNTEIDRSLVAIHLGLAYWIAGRYADAADVLSANLAAREAAYGPKDRISFQWVRHDLIASSATNAILTVLAACCMFWLMFGPAKVSCKKRCHSMNERWNTIKLSWVCLTTGQRMCPTKSQNTSYDPTGCATQGMVLPVCVCACVQYF